MVSTCTLSVTGEEVTLVTLSDEAIHSILLGVEGQISADLMTAMFKATREVGCECTCPSSRSRTTHDIGLALRSCYDASQIMEVQIWARAMHCLIDLPGRLRRA